MGQNTSIPVTQVSTQRIRPTPGSSGIRARKGTISVYCENTHSIYTIKSSSEMTIGEVKKLLPHKSCELRISDTLLNNNSTLESLEIDSKTLLRMTISNKLLQKSTSTADSFPEQDPPKIIGPKKQQQEKPQKPNHESIMSLGDDFPLPINLKVYSVPDIVLSKDHAKPSNKKNLY